MSEIDAFAASTPFQKMDIADAGRMLLAFNGNAETVTSELKMLGDIAAGTGQPLGQLAELYGKAKVQGRLFGEDINQLTGRGIPIIQALAKQFGVADSEVKKLVTEGKIGFPEMQAALSGMTGPGGKFAGMMEELSGTTAGKFSTLVDNVKLMGATIGTELLPIANDLLEWGTKEVGSLEGIGEAVKSVMETGKSWFQSTQDGLADAGIVMGVLASDWDLAWAGMFKAIPVYGAGGVRLGYREF